MFWAPCLALIHWTYRTVKMSKTPFSTGIPSIHGVAHTGLCTMLCSCTEKKNVAPI